jgi:conjugal transfer ATP-binding protein TraC
LPWVAYSAEHQLYYLRDNAACWMFECSPLVLATTDTFKSLSDMYKINLPEGSIMQLMLYADPYVEHILDLFESLRDKNPNISPVLRRQAKNYRKFLSEGTKGLRQLQGTPLKNFRLFFSIRVPIDASFADNQDAWLEEALESQNLINNCTEVLKGAGIKSYSLLPNELITTMYRLMNPELAQHRMQEWDQTKPINKQIIYADTAVEVDGSKLSFGSRKAVCLTPKIFPRQIPWTLVKNIIGYSGQGTTSMDDDMNQIMVPFIYTLSVIVEDTQAQIDNKAMLSFAQKAKGTSSQNVGNRQAEAQWLLSQKEQNEKMLKVIPQIVLLHEDERKLNTEINHVKAMWEHLGCPVQLEAQYLIKKMFVSALPGGLHEDDYDELNRSHIIPSISAGYLSPAEAGFVGVGAPYALFIDRRGQIAAFDIVKTASNKNFLITGGTGGGKSFTCNYIVGGYLACGSKVRIIDVGGSYYKLCTKVGGQYIKFAESDLVINFFETVEGDLDGDTLAMLVSIIMTMAFSRTGTSATELEMALIELAISSIFAKRKKETTIDEIADYLANLDKHFSELKAHGLADVKYELLIQSGAALAVALEKYTTRGPYGHYFYGKSTVSFNKDFVVVELDGTSEELRRVIVLAFSMLIENEIYNGDRIAHTLVLLDEAWQTLNNPAAGKFCVGLYRKARKYNASIGICIQSIKDTHASGPLGSVGDVARSQSAFWIALPDAEFDAAKSLQIINMNDYTFNSVLKRMPTNSKPNYSEFSVTIEHTLTVALRLIVDQYSYFLYTSDADDNNCLAQLEEVIKRKNPQMAALEVGAEAIEIAAQETAKLGSVMEFRRNITNIVQQLAA